MDLFDAALLQSRVRMRTFYDVSLFVKQLVFYVYYHAMNFFEGIFALWGRFAISQRRGLLCAKLETFSPQNFPQKSWRQAWVDEEHEA